MDKHEYERPDAIPEKLLMQFNEWASGEELPGRTLANLKTGRLDDLLASSERSDLTDLWDAWETAKGLPLDTLQALYKAGLAEYLGTLVVEPAG